MIDRIQFIPPRRQKFLRAVALSMQGPARDRSPFPTIIVLAVLLLALFNLFG